MDFCMNPRDVCATSNADEGARAKPEAPRQRKLGDVNTERGKGDIGVALVRLRRRRSS